MIKFRTFLIFCSCCVGVSVIGSIKWPLSRLEIHGALTADGQSHVQATRFNDGALMGGLGGGSGGTILLFLRTFVLGKHSSLSITGGKGGPLGGGGGGGGRIHFDWSNIPTGDEYAQIATVNGTINARYEIVFNLSTPKERTWSCPKNFTSLYVQ